MKFPLAFVPLIILTAALSGCGGGDSGTLSIDLSGGNGGPDYVLTEADFSVGDLEKGLNTESGKGGHGGSFSAVGGLLYMMSTGEVDTSLNLETAKTDTGENPLQVTANTTLAIVESEQDADVAYLKAIGEGNYGIFVSDGNESTDDEAVTGITVVSGRTLTFDVPEEEGSIPVIVVSADIINNGIITTGDTDVTESRQSLSIECRNFANNGSIHLEGTDPGQNGGWLYINTTYSIYNRGPVTTYGMDAQTDGGDGGSGGRIYMRAYGEFASMVFNSANLDTHGGDGTAAESLAGNGGDIELILYNDFEDELNKLSPLDIDIPDGTVYNSGTLTANGGRGVSSGGNGGNVLLENSTKETVNKGSITTAGGTCSESNGGDGGNISLFSALKLRSAANLLANGGSTESSERSGGNGGDISVIIEHPYFSRIYKETLDERIDEYLNNSPVPVCKITGNLTSRGGSAPTHGTSTGSGGDGGNIELYAGYNGVLYLSGYGNLVTKGGTGTVGGDGGFVDINYDSYYKSISEYPDYAFNCVNHIQIDASGGNGATGTNTTTAVGGNGGEVSLLGDELRNLGDIDTSGGSNCNLSASYYELGPQFNLYFGAGGDVTLFGSNLHNQGNIVTSGGSDIGTSTEDEVGLGGNGGTINLRAFQALVNYGHIFANGGAGTFAGGHAPGARVYRDTESEIPSREHGVFVSSEGTVDNGGNITCNGGNGIYGGCGGAVSITGASQDTTRGAITARCGTGTVDGEPTKGYIDDVVVNSVYIQLHDYEYTEK